MTGMVLMRRLFCIGVVLLSFARLSAVGQAPPLDTFISPDGLFQFVYPQSYELLVGERILKATQGRHQSMPVCNFSTALACVIYPIEIQDEIRFEAAGFSVNTVPGITGESDCLSFADQPSKTQAQLGSISINEHVFRHSSSRKKIPGHLQAADLYRTYSHQKCYELQIEVSLSDDSAIPRASQANSLGDAKADSARESLRLILSSFAFTQ
jgi:hypothetical protein